MITKYLRYLVLVIAVTGGLICLAGSASAHELATDGAMTVILHIDPNDTPVAGTTSTLHLYYRSSDGASAFNTTSCRCLYAVKSGEKVIQSGTVELIAGLGTDATAAVRFPAAGAYKIVVSGQPAASGSPVFSVSFNVRVDHATAASLGSTAKYEQLGIGGAAILAGGAWLVMRRRQKLSKSAT